MWLICDADKYRSEKTKTFLEKSGVSVLLAHEEKDIDAARDRDITIAIFSDGWHEATVKKVKETFDIEALLCLTSMPDVEDYGDLLNSGYVDVIAYPPNPEFVRSWDKKDDDEEDIFARIAKSKKDKTRYNKTDETITFRGSSIPRRAQVWSFVAPKGGAGKTTLSLLTATAFTARGKRVVVADLDPFGNMSVLLKKERVVSADRFETLPDSLSDNELEQVMLKATEGYWIIPHGDRPLGLSPDGVRRLIHLVSQYADILILDTHPLGIVSTIEAMRGSDRIIGVATGDRSTWAGMPEVLNLVPEKPKHIILNRIAEKPKMALSMAKFLEKEIQSPVVGIVYQDKVLYQRVQQGLMLVGARKTTKTIADITTSLGVQPTVPEGAEPQTRKKKGLFK